MAAHRLSDGGLTVADLLARERPEPPTEPMPVVDFTVPTRGRTGTRLASATTAVGLVASTALVGVAVAPEPRADTLADTVPDLPAIDPEMIYEDELDVELAAIRQVRSDARAEEVAEERKKEWRKRKAARDARIAAAEAAKAAAEQAAAEKAAAEQEAAAQQEAEEVAVEPPSTSTEATDSSAVISNSMGPVSARAQAAADSVVANVPGAALITMGGTRPSAADMNGHPSGNAIDYMVGGDTALGDAIFRYHMDNWSALGVQYIIWQQTYYDSPGSGGSFMEDRGSTTANHYDHPHVNYLP